MLIWINGPFGGGKTQTAHELLRRLPDSVVCDPEHVGYGLQRMQPARLRADFQDFPAWRQGVYEVLDQARQHHPGTVISPMTLVEPSYFDEIIGRLRADGDAVLHVALLAERATVRRRLRERVIGHTLQRVVRPDWDPPSETWALANLDRCLTRLQDPRFAEHIVTDDLTVSEVADRIAALAGLELGRADPHPVRQRLRQTWVGVQHLRRD